MATLQELADQTEPRLSASDIEALTLMLEWTEREKRCDIFVPEVKFRPRGQGHEVEIWLHRTAGDHDDRIPPHGRGEAPTLYEAWVAANEALMEDLYRFAEVGS